MRNYFVSKINGGKLFLPYMAAWLGTVVSCVAASSVAAAFLGPDVRYGIRYVAGVLLFMASWLPMLAGMCVAVFHFVRGTVGGMSLGGDAFGTEYPVRAYTVRCVKGCLLSALTLGIYTPWFMASLMRYFASETSFRTGFMEFRGRGSTLFGFAVLLVVAPVAILLLAWPGGADELSVADMPLLVAAVFVALLICVGFYRAFEIKWFIDLAFGRKRIMTEVRCGHAGWFLFGQMMLSVLTLGFYYPMALLRIWRYYVLRLVLGEDYVEDRFGFSMNATEDYLYIFIQMLLTSVTVGIYAPWAYARIASRLVGKSYVEVLDDSTEPMPADYH